MNYQQFATLLKRERQKLGKTQEEYAAYLKVARSRLVNWEQARVEPTFSLTELLDFRKNNPQLFEQIISEAQRELDRKREGESEDKIPHVRKLTPKLKGTYRES